MILEVAPYNQEGVEEMRKASLLFLLFLVACSDPSFKERFMDLPKSSFEGKILFTSEHKLMKVDGNGRNLIEIANDVSLSLSGGQSYAMHVSLDGAYIIYEACSDFSEYVEGYCEESNHFLKMIRSNGEFVRDLDFVFYIEHPNLSHDSKMLTWGTFFAGVSVFDFSIDEDPRELIGFNRSYPHDAIFSPDDQQIAFILHTYNTRYDLYVMNKDGRNFRLLTKDSMEGCDDCQMGLQWFPDGQRLIYQVVKEDDDVQGFYVAGLDGVVKRVIDYYAPFFEQGLSPDGKYYMFRANDSDEAVHELLIANTTNWKITELLDLKDLFLPAENVNGVWINSYAWSPDSKQIVVYFEVMYDYYPDGEYYMESRQYLMVVDLAGRTYRLLDNSLYGKRGKTSLLGVVAWTK